MISVNGDIGSRSSQSENAAGS